MSNVQQFINSIITSSNESICQAFHKNASNYHYYSQEKLELFDDESDVPIQCTKPAIVKKYCLHCPDNWCLDQTEDDCDYCGEPYSVTDKYCECCTDKYINWLMACEIYNFYEHKTDRYEETLFDDNFSFSFNTYPYGCIYKLKESRSDMDEEIFVECNENRYYQTYGLTLLSKEAYRWGLQA